MNQLNESKKYARLPTFVEVVYILVAGFGIDINKENALQNLGVYEYRSRLYTGSDVGELRDFSKNSRNKSATALAYEKYKNGEQADLEVSENKGSLGLSDALLSLLAGDDGVLKSRLSVSFDFLEEDIAYGRSVPLITKCSEETGLQCFIVYWAIPWFVSLMSLTDGRTSSVVYFCKKILLQEKCTGAVYLQIWKSFIKSLIPKDAKVPEFRGVIDKIKVNSHRKLLSIKKNIDSLACELRYSGADASEVQEAIKNIHAAYIAGMATLRFQSMVLMGCPGLNLIDRLVHDLRKSDGLSQETKAEDAVSYLYPFEDPSDSDVESFYIAREFYREKRYIKIYSKLGNQIIPDDIADLCNSEKHRWDATLFEAMLAEIDLKESNEIFRPYVKYAKGLWHLGHAELVLAEKYLTEFLSVAGDRQLGEVAKIAASLMIAIRLLKSPAPKSQELNPLIQIYIESMRQEETMESAFLMTPFSRFAELPEISINDFYILKSIWFFNSLPSAVGRKVLCNPMRGLCVKLSQYILASKNKAANLSIREKNTVAILGTSIKPYDAVCYIQFYIPRLFCVWHPDLSVVDHYLGLPSAEQRRVLRYIDEERYLKDCANYKISD